VAGIAGGVGLEEPSHAVRLREGTLVRWKLGRQATGYWLYYLGKGRNWDLLFIKYPPGSYIPKHNDCFPGKRHFRLNILLWGEQTFRAHGPVIFQWGPFVLFRSDYTEHEVLTSSRLRLVLSFGIVLEPKKKGP
jgi:hypothetical protein